MARVKLRCIMGCRGLKSSYPEKGLLTKDFLQIEGQSLREEICVKQSPLQSVQLPYRLAQGFYC